MDSNGILRGQAVLQPMTSLAITSKFKACFAAIKMFFGSENELYHNDDRESFAHSESSVQNSNELVYPI